MSSNLRSGPRGERAVTKERLKRIDGMQDGLHTAAKWTMKRWIAVGGYHNIYIYIYIYVCVCECKCVCVCTYVCAICLCLCTRMSIYIYIYAYTYACVLCVCVLFANVCVCLSSEGTPIQVGLKGHRKEHHDFPRTHFHSTQVQVMP